MIYILNIFLLDKHKGMNNESNRHMSETTWKGGTAFQKTEDKNKFKYKLETKKWGEVHLMEKKQWDDKKCLNILTLESLFRWHGIMLE